jgi:hypothetical protein
VAAAICDRLKLALCVSKTEKTRKAFSTDITINGSVARLRFGGPSSSIFFALLMAILVFPPLKQAR